MFQSKNKKSKIPDYCRKNMANPFFGKNKRSVLRGQPRTINKKGSIKLFLGILTFVYLFWLFLFSNTFFIKNIIINGTERINSDEITNLIENEKSLKKVGIFSENNIFIFNKSNLEKTIKTKYNLEKLDIQKKYFKRELIINIEEKPCAFTWLEDGRYYYIDTEGTIISEKNIMDVDSTVYVLLENRSQPLVDGNKITVSHNFLLKTKELFDKAKDLRYNYNIERFYITNDKNAITIKIQAGPEVIFNIENPLDKQLERLMVLKDGKLKDGFNSTQYIDLRFDDKIYYK